MNPLAASIAARTRRIVIVDDDPRLCRIIALQLRLSGIWELVGTATTAEEALQLVAATHPDVVLLDLWLGTQDTLALVGPLRAFDNPPAVVILTAEPDPAWRERALSAGAQAYLSKIDNPDIPAALSTL